jgi:hypothetical protein
MSKNFIQIIPEAISRQDCKDIIDALETKSEFFVPGVERPRGIFVDNNDSRNDISIFPVNFQSLEPATDLICDAIKANKPDDWEGNNEHWHHLENIKFQKANPGGGFTGLHTEQGNSELSSPRFMVWMMYLNDTEGGRTTFPQHDIEVTPKAGTLIYWPAAYTHYHASTPDLKSVKYIATGWFSYYHDDNIFHFRKELQSGD